MPKISVWSSPPEMSTAGKNVADCETLINKKTDKVTVRLDLKKVFMISFLRERVLKIVVRLVF